MSLSRRCAGAEASATHFQRLNDTGATLWENVLELLINTSRLCSQGVRHATTSSEVPSGGRPKHCLKGAAMLCSRAPTVKGLEQTSFRTRKRVVDALERHSERPNRRRICFYVRKCRSSAAPPQPVRGSRCHGMKRRREGVAVPDGVSVPLPAESVPVFTSLLSRGSCSQSGAP